MFNSTTKRIIDSLDSSIRQFDSTQAQAQQRAAAAAASIHSFYASHTRFYEEIYPQIKELIKIQEKHVPVTPKPDLKLLSDWISREAPNSLINEKFTFTASESATMGQGVVAKCELADGEQFLSIPRKLMLTTDNARQSELGPIFQGDALIGRFPSLLLSVFLLLERSKGAESYWHSYIQSLPKFESFRLPMLLDPSELRELQNSPTLLESLNLIRSTVRQYIHIYKILKKSGYFADSHKPVFRFSFNEFRWSVCILMSRQNRIPSAIASSGESAAANTANSANFAIALIPGWDLCNHKGKGEIRTYMNTESDCSESFTLGPVKAGEPIHLFYGRRGNPKLFLYSGFVDPENQFDYYDYFLTLPKLTESADELQNSTRKLQLLLLKKIPTTGETHSFALPLPKPTAEFIPSNNNNTNSNNNNNTGKDEKSQSSTESMDQHRIEEIESNEYRYSILLHFCRSAVLLKSEYIDVLKQKSKYLMKLNNENELKALNYLNNSLMELLSNYGTTIEEDQIKLNELNKIRFNHSNNNNSDDVKSSTSTNTSSSLAASKEQISANKISLCVEHRIIEKRMIQTAIETVKQWIKNEELLKQ